MNLRNKKELAAKALGVGKNRIKFNSEGLNEIKEAITKEDIKSLHNDGIIMIKPIKGRKKIIRRKIRRGPGKIKKKIKYRKQDYVRITRKLRKHVKKMKRENTISKEFYLELRKKIKMRSFKSTANLREYIESIRKAGSEAEENNNAENKPKIRKKASSDLKSEAHKKKTKTKEE